MLQLKTKKELAKDAFVLAQGSNLVHHKSVTYIPAHYVTRDTSVPPPDKETIWLPLSRKQIQRLAADQFDTLFGSDGELSAFDFMVAQSAHQIDESISTLLLRTPEGLRELDDSGQLVEVTGDFRPNAVLPMLNDDKVKKAQVYDVITDWLGGDPEQTESLLFHLATSLSPGWSTVKYILLLGGGRNGKSVLLKMLQGLFGRENVSNVTRQAMAEQSPTVTELNGKLLNIVYDGRAEYVKDSGTEKSLIAGEPTPIRRLYESTATIVQSNALFIEGLQREPKTSDKSSALQKRLVRFGFPNVYDHNLRFERLMLAEDTLGALLSLLVDHYVLEDEIAVKLAPTTKSIELQLEQLFANSLGLQFLKYLEEGGDPLGASAVLGSSMSEVTKMFQSWRIKENDLGTWAEPDVHALFGPLVDTERKSVRVSGQVRKVRQITHLKTEATAFIESLKGDVQDAAELIEALVED